MDLFFSVYSLVLEYLYHLKVIFKLMQIFVQYFFIYTLNYLFKLNSHEQMDI